MAKTKPKKSILQDCLRDAYEEFAKLLYEEIEKNDPKGKTNKKIRDAMERVLNEHFGKDEGGGIFL